MQKREKAGATKSRNERKQKGEKTETKENGNEKKCNQEKAELRKKMRTSGNGRWNMRKETKEKMAKRAKCTLTISLII